MNYIAYQSDESDCGFASLKMLLANLSHNKSYLSLPKPLKKELYTYEDLIKIAGENGLILKAYEETEKNLSLISSLPALLTLDDSVTYLKHTVYVYKVTDKKVYYNDPNEGNCVLNKDKFEKLWDGSFLLVEENKIKPYKTQERRLLPFKRSVPALTFHVLSMASLIIGFFFVKEGEWIMLPLIFIIAFSLLELVENWLIIKNIQYFDDMYLRDYLLSTKKDKKEAYKDFLSFRTLYFNTPRNGLIYILLISIIVLVLIINNPYNVFPILFFLILAIIDQILTKKVDLDQELAIKERTVLSNEPDEDFYDNIVALSREGTKRGYNVSIKTCLYTFLLLTSSVIMMVVSKVSSVNFILFNFAIYYVLFEHMRKVVNFDNEQIEYRKQKAKFLENISINIE